MVLSTQQRAINTAFVFAGLASAVLLYKFATRPAVVPVSKLLKDTKDDDEEYLEARDNAISTPKLSKKDTTEKTPLTSNMSSKTAAVIEDAAHEENTEEDGTTTLHTRIEEIDKKGKALFKAKKYLDAAEVFTEAIDLVYSKVADVSKNLNLKRQMITLVNNRSAMYEKADIPDLALVGKFSEK